MSSYRHQIKDAIQAQLTGKTIAGSNVLTKLDRPVNPASDLPMIMVYTMAAKRGNEDFGNSLIPRTLTVAIEAAVASNTSDAITDAEDFADAIETAMEADPTLGMLVSDTKWRLTISDVSSAGDVILGVCVLEYDVDIMTNLKPEDSFTYPEIPVDIMPTKVFIEAQPVYEEYKPYEPPPPPSPCEDGTCDVPAWGNPK